MKHTGPGRRMIFLTVLLPACLLSFGQRLQLLSKGLSVSLRGLSVVNDSVFWVSGTAGTTAVSTDGGMHWKWMQVPGFEKSDFRDIEAFSAEEAIIMGITEPAVILRTTDGGRNWKEVLKDSSKEVFLDALSFSADSALAIGDPIQRTMFLAISSDRGENWNTVTGSKSAGGILRVAKLDSGEAFFAASGSNLQPLPHHQWVAVTGGRKSRIFFSGGSVYPLHMLQGDATTGANSIAVNPENSNEGFVVGGDFAHDTSRAGNALRIQFAPFVEISPAVPPHGYRSCVEYLDDKRLVTCGTSGVDFSSDGGLNWKLISNSGFHVCRRSKSGKAVFLAGAQGRIARLEITVAEAGK